MLITVGAIFLLSMVILNVNRGIYWTNDTMVDNRYGILGVSLATSIIEKATSKSFDAKTDGAAITTPTVLTAANSLGLESGESFNDPDSFNDFDDFNCYKTKPKKDSIIVEGMNSYLHFWTYCTVTYVKDGNPEAVSTTQTYHKRLNVTVTSPDLKIAYVEGKTKKLSNDSLSIKMSTVYSYWYFR